MVFIYGICWVEEGKTKRVNLRFKKGLLCQAALLPAIYSNGEQAINR